MGRQCVKWERLKTTAPVAFIYALADIVELVAISKTNSAYYLVVGQLKLMFAAMFSKAILGRGQSSLQWLLLAGITLAAIGYCILQMIPVGSAPPAPPDAFGTALCLVKACLASMNAVLTERAFKKAPEEAIWVNQAQLKLCSLPITIVFVFIQSVAFCDTLRPGQCLFQVGFFYGWNARVVCLVGFQIFNAVVIGSVYKHVNAVVKYLAYAQSLWVTYCMHMVIGADARPFDLHVFAVIVILVLLVIAYPMAKKVPAIAETPSSQTSFLDTGNSRKREDEGIQMRDIFGNLAKARAQQKDERRIDGLVLEACI